MRGNTGSGVWAEPLPALPASKNGQKSRCPIVIGREDAAKVVAGDPASFYEMVRARVHDWELMPSFVTEPTVVDHPDLSQPHVGATGTSEVSETVDAPSTPDTEQVLEVPTPADMPLGLPEPVGKGISLEIGKTIDGFRPRDLVLNLSDTRLNQLNIGVVGDLGTGKTQLLKSLITQIASSGLRPMRTR